MAMPHTITPREREVYRDQALARVKRHRMFAQMSEDEGNLEEKEFWLKHAAEAEKMADYWSKKPEE